MINITNPEECYFLKIKDECMNKIIKKGAYALIRKFDDEKNVKNGEIVVTLINKQDAILRKYTKQGELVILEPLSNNSNFEIQVCNKSTEIKVIGKYVGKFETN